jgi:hypothetical protein
MNKQVSPTNILILTTIILFTISIFHAAASELIWQNDPQNGKTIVKELGYIGLSIPSECLSSRNPILEPICLADIPGGYCYHESCAKVAPIYIGKTYTIEVIHP